MYFSVRCIKFLICFYYFVTEVDVFYPNTKKINPAFPLELKYHRVEFSMIKAKTQAHMWLSDSTSFSYFLVYQAVFISL